MDWFDMERRMCDAAALACDQASAAQDQGLGTVAVLLIMVMAFVLGLVLAFFSNPRKDTQDVC